MVKREKSPEAIDDVILFVVWMPYPLNPNWVYEEDVQSCAKWVAEVIGNGYYLISIHQKPSSRGMILLEISKDFTDHGRLLGEHQWSDFLKGASKEEGHKTRVYYSIYRTCRESKKDGWNPIQVPIKWFKSWSPGIGRFVSPYPEPRHCVLPPEDKTSKPICRHIPLRKPAPENPIAPKTDGSPVVGSSAWIAQQKEEIPNSESTAARRRQSEMNNAATTGFAATPNLPQFPIGGTSVLPQSDESSMIVLPRSKAKAVPLQKFMSQPQVPPKRVQAPAWIGRSMSSHSSSTGQKQPSMGEPPAKPQNAWANPLKIVPPKPAKITTNPDSTMTWQSSHESWSDIMEDEMVLEADDTKPDESTCLQPLTSLHGKFNPKGLLNETESSSIPSYTTSQHSDDECDSDLEAILPPIGNSGDAGTTINEPSGNKDWGKDWSDAEEDSKKKKQDILCPTHGPACSKKICQDYQKLDRERKKEEAKKSGQWQGRGRRGRGRGRGRWPFKAGDTGSAA